MSEAPARRRTAPRQASWAAAAATAFAAVCTAYLLLRSGVATADLVVYGAFLGIGLLAPGFVLWRLLVSRGSPDLLVDVACGSALACALHLAAYATCSAVGSPGLARWWPVIPLAISVLPQARPLVWTRSDVRSSASLPWALAGLWVFAAAVLTRYTFTSYGLDERHLRFTYLDIPYHLSLVTSLMRGVPPELATVAGQPINYHWFMHAHVAATQQATGIEAAVLLLRLEPLAMVGLVIVGTAGLARRLTRSRWMAALAALVLVGVAGLPMLVDFGKLFSPGHVFLSPTTIYAQLLLVGFMGVCLHMLGPSAAGMPRWSGWPAAVVLLLASSGAKGTLVPLIVAGLAAVLLMGLVLRRRVVLTALGLLVASLVSFILALRFVYAGAGGQGLAIHPFETGAQMASRLGVSRLPFDEVPLWLGVALTLVTMVGTTAPFIGVLGLFTSPTWRDPRAHFLVGVAAAALVGPVVFASPSLNQAYFLLVAPPALVLAGVWGFHVLATRVDPARLPRLLALGALPGLALAGLAVAAERNAWATVPTLPNIGARILALLLVIFLVSLVAHRSDGAGRLVAVTTTLAVGCAFLMSWSWTLAAEPRALFRPDPPAQALIGPRGVEAARWIRAHSRADDVVVVNAHCLLPPERPRCDRRNAWVSAFTERQVLVESWAYSRRAKLESERTGVGRMTMDFWDPGLLSLNDRAFTSPDPALLRQLRDQHGVRWMLADRRFPVRIERLRKVAEERADFGRYVVFAVR